MTEDGDRDHLEVETMNEEEENEEISLHLLETIVSLPLLVQDQVDEVV